MKLNVKALVLTCAIFWAGAVFLTGLANLNWPGYGSKFLELVASLYPGYKAAGSFSDLLIGTLYALVDGAFSGLVFGFIYNLFAGKN